MQRRHLGTLKRAQKCLELENNEQRWGRPSWSGESKENLVKIQFSGSHSHHATPHCALLYWCRSDTPKCVYKSGIWRRLFSQTHEIIISPKKKSCHVGVYSATKLFSNFTSGELLAYWLRLKRTTFWRKNPDGSGFHRSRGRHRWLCNPSSCPYNETGFVLECWLVWVVLHVK